MAELLAVEGLTAGYGDGIVLEDVALTIDEGDSLALLGRNGMGKTTLLVTLMGFTRLHRGTLRWRGRDLAALPTHRRSRSGIGWVPQERLHVPVAHRRGAPDRGRAARAVERGAGLRDLPAARGAAREFRQPALRRRAADARDRPRADGQPRAAAAGRADGGSRAHHRAGADGRDPRARRGRRDGGDRRRAARQAGPDPDAQCDRAGARPRRPPRAERSRCCATPRRCTGWWRWHEPPGRPKGEYRSAQREGTPAKPRARPRAPRQQRAASSKGQRR